jgi:peroxisomal coenzyme A diphosphatase NUDT7
VLHLTRLTSSQPILNQAEVVSLFSHPLRGFLSRDAPSSSLTPFFIQPFNSSSTDSSTSEETRPSSRDSIVADSDTDPIPDHPVPPAPPPTSLFTSDQGTYHTCTDVSWTGSRDRRVRMHRFLTGREAGGTRPIYGLTACVGLLLVTSRICLYTHLSTQRHPYSYCLYWLCSSTTLLSGLPRSAQYGGTNSARIFG